MKEQAIQKINKVGKISYIITIICKILLIVGFVCSVAGAVIWLALPVDTMKVTQRNVMQVEMSQEGLGDSISQTELEEMKQSLDAGEQWQVKQVQNGMVGPNLEILSTGQNYIPVAIDVTEDNVFVEMISEEVSFTMREVSVMMLLLSVVMLMSIVTLTFVEKLCKAFRDCESPFEENVIQKMQRVAICLIPWTLVSSLGDTIANSMMSGGMHWTFSIDLGVVLVVLIVLILVYIFKYGAVLQQESDETL